MAGLASLGPPWAKDVDYRGRGLIPFLLRQDAADLSGWSFTLAV